jgi:hypothetical protein
MNVCIVKRKRNAKRMASDYTLPNLIKEEQRYINKSGSGGREMKKQRRKAEDKQRNKMQRFDRQYL